MLLSVYKMRRKAYNGVKRHREQGVRVSEMGRWGLRRAAARYYRAEARRSNAAVRGERARSRLASQAARKGALAEFGELARALRRLADEGKLPGDE
jgi:hypothetical protein